MAGPVLIDRGLLLQADFTPAAVSWNRLEGRPRAEDFGRSLKAEVRDPLWMICRQWQFGEFRAENTGSAIKARLQLRVATLDCYAAGDDDVAGPFDDSLPLEVRVEREPIPMALGVRVRIGRHFCTLAGPLWNSNIIRAKYLEEYDIDSSADPERAAYLASDPKARAYFFAVQGRIPDGRKLVDDIRSGRHETVIAGLPISTSERDQLRAAADGLVAWLTRLYSVPAAADTAAWQPSRLEYRFACGAPVSAGGDDRLVLAAKAHAGGDLEWHAFDVDRAKHFHGSPSGPLPDAVATDQAPVSFLPAPIEYGGMPNARFWQFEDGKTSFGDIRPGTTDLALLVLAEYALIYGNDWMLVPYDLAVGSLATIRGVVVTDVFGVRTFVRAAGSRTADAWQHWNIFTLRDLSSEGVDAGLLLLPTLAARQESVPIEAVSLTRDEMANMVFAIEERIPGEIGMGVGGAEAAAAFDRHLRDTALPDETVALETDARIRYLAGTTVPENWIPFLPVQISAVSGDVRLQRGRMARTIPGAPAPTVAPRGEILRHGLDRTPAEAYFIEEEEVPSGGARVARAYQRTRWYDGRVYVWIGRRKTPGRGDSDSGLRFDQIESLDKSSA